MRALWLVCLVVTPGALLIQQASSLQLGAISSVHAENLVTFLWVLLAWLWPVRTRRPLMLGLTIGLSLVSQLLTSVALGGEWGTSTRVAAVTIVQAGVTLALYRWRIGDDNLTPHRPSDIVDLLAASLVGALVVIPLGPAPGLGLTSGSFELFWWTLISTAYVFVGGACLLLLVQRRPREEAIPTRVMDVYLQLLVTGVCLGVVFTFDGLPLTWIVMLPAIWAGMSLGPWTSAAYSTTGALAVVTAQAIPDARRTTGVSELSGSLLDRLMTAFVFVVLLLSLLRDQRAHLAGRGRTPSAGGPRPGRAAQHRLRVDQRRARALRPPGRSASTTQRRVAILARRTPPHRAGEAGCAEHATEGIHLRLPPRRLRRRPADPRRSPSPRCSTPARDVSLHSCAT